MSALTKDERDGLEEVFLSIQNSHNRYKKLKLFISFWSSFVLHTMQKNAKSGKFRDKLTKKYNFFHKVKKNLSK